MLARSLDTRSFRNLADAETELGAGITVLSGPNGAGKTNLLEALFFALTGRSPRTRRERELIRFGHSLVRAEVRLGPGDRSDPVATGAERRGGDSVAMLASVSTTDGRQRRVDGRPHGPEDDRRRPAVSIFMPDRLALVKGPPGPRRAHLDRVVAAIWPARAGARAGYGRALAQRNALLARLRRGGDPAALEPWDAALSAAAVPLIAARAAAGELLAGRFATAAAELGLAGEAELHYEPRTGELDREAGPIAAELAARRDGDVSRGYTGWGPHLDEVSLRRDGRPLRRYGSQGEQRLALLALLFSEREALRAARRSLPLMLLDDVMSELDPDRRGRLVELLAEGGGQAVITATEADQVPGSADRWIELSQGAAIAAGG